MSIKTFMAREKMGLFRWMVSWAELIDGLVGVLSLGMFRPDLSTPMRMWVLMKEAKDLVGDDE